MIRVKTTREIDVARLDRFSRRSWESTPQLVRDQWLRMSIRVVLVSFNDEPLCTIGIRPTSMLGTGYEIWFLIYEPFRRHLRAFLRWAKKFYPVLGRACGRLLVRVDESYLPGLRLVQAFGMTPTGFDFGDGQTFRRYEASWLSHQY